MVQICVSCNNQNAHLAEGGPQNPNQDERQQFVESNVSSSYREQAHILPASPHQLNNTQVPTPYIPPVPSGTYLATKKISDSENTTNVRYKVSFYLYIKLS
jgi:hypothetical protein